MLKILLLSLAVCWSLGGADLKLAWSDEFNGEGLPDPSKWSYEEGFFYNNEAQYYTAARTENIRQEDGVLIIEARREKWINPRFREGSTQHGEDRREAEYTSARIITRGKAEWRYGRIEARARLPKGRGTWPAIWMLGSNIDKVDWPRCGEIDIMEYVGYDPETIHANIHTEAYNHTRNTNKGSKISVAKPWSEFHVYAVEWTPERMDFFVDDRRFFTYRNEKRGEAAWPFDQPFFLILNLAVGGNWGGREGIDNSIFPLRMEVDYVRVYQGAQEQR